MNWQQNLQALAQLAGDGVHEEDPVLIRFMLEAAAARAKNTNLFIIY